MKTSVLFLALFATASAYAGGYKLNDPAILGEYTLQPADPNAEVQTMRVHYSVDNVLEASTDNNDYELSQPDKDGVVYDEDGEPNCDGDEQSCTYDAHTLIQLLSTKVGDKTIPQLSIQITTDDAFDDSGKSVVTTTYTLNWSRSLPDAIPYYTSTTAPAALQTFLDACDEAVSPTVGYEIGNSADICSINNSYKYRGDWNEALPYFQKGEGASKEISLQDLKTTIFPAAEAVIQGYDQDRLKVPTATLLTQFKQLEAYIAKSDKLYYSQFAYDAVVSAVNTKTKVVTVFMIRNQK